MQDERGAVFKETIYKKLQRMLTFKVRACLVQVSIWKCFQHYNSVRYTFFLTSQSCLTSDSCIVVSNNVVMLVFWVFCFCFTFFVVFNAIELRSISSHHFWLLILLTLAALYKLQLQHSVQNIYKQYYFSSIQLSKHDILCSSRYNQSTLFKLVVSIKFSYIQNELIIL